MHFYTACFFFILAFAAVNGNVVKRVRDDPLLDQIKSRIQEKSEISTYTIGASLASMLNTTLQVPEFSITNISFNLNGDTLTVTCGARIWDNQASVFSTMIFTSNGTTVSLAMSFKIAGSIQTWFKFVSHDGFGKPIPRWLSEITASQTVEFVICTASGSTLGKQGVTLEADVTIINGTLLEAIKRLKPSATGLDVDASLYIPMFGGDPSDISMDLKATGGSYSLSKNIEVVSLEIDVTLPESIEIIAGLQITLHPNGQEEVVSATVSANFVNSGTFTLEGDITSNWSHPFGIKWLTITSAECKIVFQGLSLQSLSINAVGSVTWSPRQANFIISISGDDLEDILLAAENIPCDKTVDRVYSDITGKSIPQILKEVQLTGNADFAISTYDGPQFQKGFTFEIDATVTQGNIIKAIQHLVKNVTSTTWTYDFSLYVTIFGGSPDRIEAALVENGPYQVTKSISGNEFVLDLNLNTENPQLTLTADLTAKVRGNQTVQFQAYADVSGGNEQVEFKGTLQSDWVAPLGQKWITIKTGGDIDLVLGGDDYGQLSIHADCLVDFYSTTQPVTVDGQIGGEDLADDYFKLSNFPVTKQTITLMYQHVFHKTPPAILNEMNPQGTAMISLSTYDGPVQEGFTFETVVTITDNGDLWKASKYLNPNPSQLNFDFYFYAGHLFSENWEVDIKLTEQGAFKMTKTITCESYSMNFDLSDAPDIQLAVDLSIVVKRQPDPLGVSVTADFNAGAESLSFTGSITNWEHPFGRQWLNITTASVSFVLSASAGVESLDFSGSGVFRFNGKTVQYGSGTISVSFNNDFTDATLTVSLTDQWTIYEISKDVLGNEPSELVKDIEVNDQVSMSFSLSTSMGVTLSVSAQVTGGLQSTFKKYNYWWDHPGNTFSVSVSLPIFSSNPLGISIALTYSGQNITISKHIWFDALTFSLTVEPFAVSITSTFFTEFNKNPITTYQVSGSFQSDLSFLGWGAMEGVWRDPFGIKGFNLSNVILEIGFNPSDCATSACISDLGFGAEMFFIHDTIQFDGNAAFPDFWDVFLFGSFKKNENSNGLLALPDASGSLAILDIANEWTLVNPSKPVNTKGIPKDWSLQEASFYFAPIDGTFGPIHYAAGFGITGTMTIVGITVSGSVNCTDGAGFNCDFAFHCALTPSQLWEAIKHALVEDGSTTDSFDFFDVHSVSLTNWSEKNSAASVHPRWQIAMTVWDKSHNLDFDTPQAELSNPFKDFYDKYIKHLFG